MSTRGGALLLLASAFAAAAGAPLLPCLLVASLGWLAAAWRTAATTRTVLFVAVLARLPLLLVDAGGDDLNRYVWEGKIQLAGFSPYAHAPDDPALAHLRDDRAPAIDHAGLPTIYPPLAQALFAGLAAAGFEREGFRTAMVLLDLATVALLLVWMRKTGRPPGRAVLYAWSPVAIAASTTGHVDPLMLLALAGFGLAWETGHLRAAAALAGAAILAKTVAVLLVPWLVLRRPRAVPGITLPVVVLGYLPWLPQGNVTGSLVAFASDFAFNASVVRLLEFPLGGTVARAAAAALLVAWTALVALWHPRPAAAVALLLAGLLALSPTVHFWYLTWFLVALPAVGARRWTAPLLGWSVSVLAVGLTYVEARRGGAFREHLALTALEYAVPAALLAWAGWTGRPRRPSPRTPESDAVPPGTFAVVLPCMGEAANLREVLPDWNASGAERVIVADTPTDDGTEALTRGLQRVSCLAVPRRGYGEAVAAGIEACGPVDFVVVADADHRHGPAQVRALLAPLADPRVALVTGARPPGSMTAPQRFGNALASVLIGIGWGVRFADFGAFRALRRAALPLAVLTDRGFGWNVEMNVRALERGHEVVEVALPPARRLHGRDRISAGLRGVLGAGWGILWRIQRLREQACARPS